MNNRTQTPAFGKEMRDKGFALQREAVFLNHGYIGAVPIPVIEVQNQYIESMRRRPAHFFMRRKFPLWKEARDAAADFLKTDPDSIVLVQNVSTGKEIHGEIADVYGSSAPSYGIWAGEFKRGRTSLEDEARSERPLDATDEELCNKVRHLVYSDRRIQVEEIAQTLGISHGLNTIINSVTMKDGDSILTTNHNYGAAKCACMTKAEKYNDSILYCVDITFPISNEEQVVELYKEFFVTHPNVKMAIIDYISCACAMKLPLEQILQVCKEYKVTSVVDGAHTLGHIPVDLSTLQADFFTGCFHKWAFTPWGCAVVWMNKNYGGYLKPVATSILLGEGPTKEFFMQGTRDESAFFSLPAALKFINDIGGLSKIYEYNIELIEKGREYLVRHWRTEKLPLPPSLEAPFLRMIRLPHIPGYDEPSVDAAERLMTEIHERFDIDTCIKYINGYLYLRLSIQIYNTMDDVFSLCNAVLQMSEQGSKSLTIV